MIYSGDISFSIKETDIPYKQYYLSNKVVFSIYMPGKILNKVTIEYEANLNTFFNAKYSIDSVNNEQLQDIVPSGESYLVQINPSSQIKSKTVLIKSAYNYRRPFKTPMMVNFFEINCKFLVTRLFDYNATLTFSDGYAQDYYTPERALIMDMFDYHVEIQEVDPSNNNNKMCIF